VSRSTASSEADMRGTTARHETALTGQKIELHRSRRVHADGSPNARVEDTNIAIDMIACERVSSADRRRDTERAGGGCELLPEPSKHSPDALPTKSRTQRPTVSDLRYSSHSVSYGRGSAVRRGPD